jgi:hypothetical protein
VAAASRTGVHKRREPADASERRNYINDRGEVGRPIR